MWIEETRNGKYKAVERYTDYLTGKTKRVSVTMEKNTAQARKVAQIALQEKIRQAYTGKKEEKKLTFADLVEQYREDQKLTVKMSTYKRNYFACNTLKDILGENTLVNRLSAKYVRDRFLATGKAPGTLNEHMTRFKALIRWGYHNDLISDISYLDKLEPFKDTPHKEKIQDKYLEAEELKKLLDGMKIEKWKLLTKFLALSGLRFGEAAALLISDMDLKERVIHVTKTFDPVNLVVTTPKTLCSVRDVYIQDELKALCKQIKLHTLQQNILFGHPDSQILFSSESGDYIEYYAYNKYLKENSLKILKRGITAHTLRHTHASLLLEQGVPIDVISRRLGHENSQVTREIYLHVTEKLKEKDNERIKNIKII